jgi:hypothetical protein
MENNLLKTDQTEQGEKKDTLVSRDEILRIFRECSVEDLRARRDVVILALEKNYSKKEKNANIEKLIRRYEWEVKTISEILEGR